MRYRDIKLHRIAGVKKSICGVWVALGNRDAGELRNHQDHAVRMYLDGETDQSDIENCRQAHTLAFVIHEIVKDEMGMFKLAFLPLRSDSFTSLSPQMVMIQHPTEINNDLYSLYSVVKIPANAIAASHFMNFAGVLEFCSCTI